MGSSQPKVPTIVATGILGLCVGVGIGVLGMAFFGEQSYPGIGTGSATSPETVGAPGAPAADGPPGAAAGASGGGGREGPRGPSPKWQLAILVTKLDLLSRKPLAVHFNEEQQKKVHEQIQGLETMEELSVEEAQKRLDALLEVVKDQTETLEAAGYRWPGQGRFRPPADTPNPFHEEKNAQALKSLQERLSVPASK